LLPSLNIKKIEKDYKIKLRILSRLLKLRRQLAVSIILMKKSLAYKIQHQLSLTPSLTHAISLLQLSNTELHEEIEAVVAKNPMISSDYTSSQHQDPHDLLMSIPDNNPQLLHNHLHHQLIMMHFDDSLYKLGCRLIDNLDEVGFINPEFFDSLCPEHTFKLKGWLRQSDPLGIGATNIIESLCWQLEPLIKKNTFAPMLMNFILNNDFSTLALKKLKKQYKFSQSDGGELSHLLNCLNFNPAQYYHNNHLSALYQQPDLIVYKMHSEFKVRLNEDILPKLKLDELAFYPFQEKDMKELVQQAKYFIKVIDTRFDTLIKTAKLLVEHQKDFFIFGQSGLKTLILKDIAQELGLHESTISRIIANKLIATPTGVIELKTLLSRGLQKNSGESISTASIKQTLLELIQHESSLKPLSDQYLTNILKKQGFCIARRTVTKYRKELALQTSNQRKIY
jgi:RNA polymerase sigma-54 factor